MKVFSRAICEDKLSFCPTKTHLAILFLSTKYSYKKNEKIMEKCSLIWRINEDNFTEEELKKIELSHKQAKEGKLLKSENVFKKLRVKYKRKTN